MLARLDLFIYLVWLYYLSMYWMSGSDNILICLLFINVLCLVGLDIILSTVFHLTYIVVLFINLYMDVLGGSVSDIVLTYLVLLFIDVLGGTGSDTESSSSGDEDSDDNDDDGANEQEDEEMKIQDETQMNTMALRRTIYLTIMSSLSFEECAHKMLQMSIKPGPEVGGATNYLQLQLCTLVLKSGKSSLHR